MSPALIEAHSVRARVLRHAGDLEAAARAADKARSMDLSDRYLNCLAVKAMFRAGHVSCGSAAVAGLPSARGAGCGGRGGGGGVQYGVCAGWWDNMVPQCWQQGNYAAATCTAVAQCTIMRLCGSAFFAGGGRGAAGGALHAGWGAGQQPLRHAGLCVGWVGGLARAYARVRVRVLGGGRKTALLFYCLRELANNLFDMQVCGWWLGGRARWQCWVGAGPSSPCWLPTLWGLPVLTWRHKSWPCLPGRRSMSSMPPALSL